MGLFNVTRTRQAQAERDQVIQLRTARQLTDRQLQEQLRAAGDVAVDLDKAVGSKSQREKIDQRGLVEALKVAVETAEYALAETVRLRAALEKQGGN